jgi:hypothetical protein
MTSPLRGIPLAGAMDVVCLGQFVIHTWVAVNAVTGLVRLADLSGLDRAVHRLLLVFGQPPSDQAILAL